MIIRAARPDEAAQLADLHLRTALAAYAHIFPPEAPVPDAGANLEHWHALLEPDAIRRVFVAEGGGVRAGVVVAGLDGDSTDVGQISRLYVEVDRWSQGIGAALHDAAVAHLRPRVASLTLWVLESNSRARRFYERRGWVATGARKIVFAGTDIADAQYRLDVRP